MNIISELKNIDGHFSITLIALFIAIVAPGVLTIYLFLPELFIDLDSLKFLLFSISLSLPVFVVNGLVTTWFDALDDRSEVEYRSIGMLTSFLSSFSMYLSLFVAYLYSFEFKKFLLFGASVELVLIFLLYVMFQAYKNR